MKTFYTVMFVLIGIGLLVAIIAGISVVFSTKAAVEQSLGTLQTARAAQARKGDKANALGALARERMLAGETPDPALHDERTAIIDFLAVKMQMEGNTLPDSVRAGLHHLTPAELRELASD